MLRALGISKTFRAPDGQAVPVLDRLDVEVKAGEFVAVAGSSGSGKSTLLNLIGLLEPLDDGEIWLDEVCVSRLSRRAQCRVRGRSIGYVFQSFLLIAGLTALENVLLAARYVGRSAARPCRRRVRSWSGSGSRTGAGTIRPSSRAESSSGSRTAARCSTPLRSCSPTSPPAIWTRATPR